MTAGSPDRVPCPIPTSSLRPTFVRPSDKRAPHLSNADLQALPLSAFQQLALWLLRDARKPARLLAHFDAWVPAMRQAGRTRSGLDALAVLLEYMFQVVSRKHWDELHAKLHALSLFAEEAVMRTIADMFRAEGRAKGRAEGRAEGRAKGRIETLRSLLIYKFQTLDATTEARLQAATPRAIDRYLRRLLTADSLAAVFED